MELDKKLILLNTFTDKNYKCPLFDVNIITEGFKSNFKTTIHQLRYSLDNLNDRICSFQLILIIIKYHNKEFINLTIDLLKQKLISLYKNNNNFNSLCEILLKNNKKVIMEEVVNEKITTKKLTMFEERVLSSEYYVTYIDIYLLSKEYDLPIILLCNTIIDLTITKEKFIIFNLSRTNNYFFIKNRSLYDRKKLHNYKLLINSSSVDFNVEKDLQDSNEYKLSSKIKYTINNYEDVLGNYINNYGLNDKKQIAELKKLEKQKQVKQKKLEKQEQVKQKKLEKQEKVKKQALEEPQEVKQKVKKQTEKIKQKRCPNGTRKNKETGNCEKI